MSITLNRFTTGVLTTAQLNALVDAIVAKFNGQVTTGDLASPLKLPGNLDMQQFEILHLYKLWNTRNLAERSSSTTVQDVFDEVNTAGGGVVLLPADTTETIGTSGVSVGAGTLIVGGGDTSIFATAGTVTNHMFRNKVNGDSGIVFMNLKLDNTGATGGAFNIVGLARTVRVRFVDCWFVIKQERGVSLSTDSAGSSCVNTKFVRCQFDLNTGTGSCIHMTDVQRVKITECEFNVIPTNSTAITFTATGATSNCDRITIDDNDILFTTTGTGKHGIAVSAGATNGITHLKIINNEFNSATTGTSQYIDIDGGVSTVVSHTKVLANTVRGGDTQDFAMRFRNLKRFDVADNSVTVTGNGYGVLIGATAASGSVAACNDYIVSRNNINASQTCYVFCHPSSVTLQATISDNKAATLAGAGAEYEIWNLGANPSTLTFDSAIHHNMCDDASGSPASWRCYTNLGTTQGGRAGDVANCNLIFSQNQATGVTFGAAGANDDFYNATDAAVRKFIVADNIV